MKDDELKRLVAGILKMLVKTTQQDRIDFDEDMAHEQIFYLLAPTIEKAEKWDKVKECAYSRPPCKCPLWEEDACTLEYGGCIFRDVVDALEGGTNDKS